MQSRSRGQTESLGAILLVGVVVVGVATFGAFYLGTVAQSDATRADLDVTVRNASAAGNVTVRVTHAGGERLRSAETLAVVEFDGTKRRKRADTNGTLTGADPATFGQGERWTVTVGFPGAVTACEDRVGVVVADEGSNAVLHDGSERVLPRGAGAEC